MIMADRKSAWYFGNTNGYTEVILVAHSMGGLVASSYLARSAANRNKTKKLITMGTPYLGSPKAVYVMETGKLFGNWFNDALFAGGLKTVAPNMPAVYELLPPSRNFERYIKKYDLATNSYLIANNYTVTTDFLKTLNWCKKSNGTAKPMITNAATYHTNLVNAGMSATGFSGVETHKFYGSGFDTVSYVKYNASGIFVDVETSNLGDGTVLRLSACNGSYSYAHNVLQGHVEMVKHIPTINSVIGIIAGASTMSTLSQQSETVNENGWLVGPQFDNRRVSVDIGGVEQINIAATSGEPVVEEDGVLYKVNSDGSKEQVGTTYIIGGGYDKKYYLHNGEYNFAKPASAETEIVSFRIKYYNDGYLEKSVTFENVECYTAELSVKDYYVQETECFVDDAPEAIAPTSVQ